MKNYNFHKSAIKATPKFTLLELIFVIVIFLVLVALLLPILQKAKHSTKLVIGLSNQRQIFLGQLEFAKDRDGINSIAPLRTPWHAYVASNSGYVADNPVHIGRLYTQEYVDNIEVFYSPLSNECPNMGVRSKDYIEKNSHRKGEWRSYSGQNFGGNYTRSSFMVNTLQYRKAGIPTPGINTDYDFDSLDRAPFITDWLTKKLWNHSAPIWNMVKIDGSGKSHESFKLDERMQTTNLFGDRWHLHAWGLDALLEEE